MQDTKEIPRDAWDKFFSRFSDDHETQFVAVEVMGQRHRRTGRGALAAAQRRLTRR